MLTPPAEYSAAENDPWVPSLLGYVKQAYQAEIPIAVFCYGHQIIAKALGGQVTLSPGGYELGVQEVTTSSQGVEILGTKTLVLPVAQNHVCTLLIRRRTSPNSIATACPVCRRISITSLLAR